MTHPKRANSFRTKQPIKKTAADADSNLNSSSPTAKIGPCIALSEDRKIAVDQATDRIDLPDGWLRLRVLQCLVSSLDVEVCRGAFAHTGIVGHQAVAEVLDSSRSSDGHWVGKRVCVDPVLRCGECDRCQGGLPTHCRDRRICGVSGADGFLTPIAAVPATNVHEVPANLSNEHAAFAVLAGAALQVKRQVAVERRPFITVLGDGPLGLLTAQALAGMNATVRMIGRFSEKMVHCERWGIKHRHIDDIGRRRDQDAVIDCTGEPGGLATALRLVRAGGTIVTKTLAPDSAWQASEAVNWSDLAANEIRVLGSFLGSVREGIAALSRRALQTEGLITRRMRLADGADILHAAARPESISILVDTTG